MLRALTSPRGFERHHGAAVAGERTPVAVAIPRGHELEAFRPPQQIAREGTEPPAGPEDRDAQRRHAPTAARRNADSRMRTHSAV